MHDKIITSLFVFLIAGAAIFAHINQNLRVELARLEEQRLDMAGVVGWLRYDQEAMQFVYTGRR